MFFRNFTLSGEIAKATLELTAIGVYEAMLNNQRVGGFILAPRWTTYRKRLQVQTYDITELLRKENELTVTVGKGWYRSWYSGSGSWPYQEPGMTARITMEYADGSREVILSDEAWKCGESSIWFSEIYDGEICDGTWQTVCDQAVAVFDGPTEMLIPHEVTTHRTARNVLFLRQHLFQKPLSAKAVAFIHYETCFAADTDLLFTKIGSIMNI